MRPVLLSTREIAILADMPKTSAGCLVTRVGSEGTEVLLVHARGATFRRPLFGIPKGAPDDGEDLQTAAIRETREETGLVVELRADLGSVQQKSGKIVRAFWASVTSASESGIDARGRCRKGDWENDVCRFYPLDKAEPLMIPAQREFLQRFQALHTTRDANPSDSRSES